MIIEYIKLKNYRQYQNQKIDLNVDIEKNKRCIVIVGPNGSGKSNILNAICWCLYGKEPYLKNESKKYPIVNSRLLRELKTGGIGEVEVEILLRKKDKKYRIGRRLRFRKIEKFDEKLKKDIPTIEVLKRDGNQPDGTYLEILFSSEDGSGYFSYPSRIVQRILPEDINEYFIFDGERLDHYFREEAGEKVKEAVYRISQIEILERVIDHLEEAKRELERECKNISPETRDIIQQKEYYEKKLDEKKKECQELERKKTEISKTYDDLLEKIKKSEVVKNLVEGLQRNEDLLKQLKKDIKDLEDEYYTYLLKKAPFVISQSGLKYVKKMIDERKEGGEIPPDIKRNFLKKLLEEGRCICGTDISYDNPHRRNIEKLFQERPKISDISEDIINLHANITHILGSISTFEEGIRDYNQKIDNLKNKISETNERIENLENEIKKLLKSKNLVDIDTILQEIKSTENLFDHYRKEQETIVEEISRIRVDIQSGEKMLQKLELKLKEELAAERKLSDLSKQIGLCEEALNFLKQIRANIIKEVRESVERRTRSLYSRFSWSGGGDIHVDENYGLSYRDETGIEGIGSLSTGITQMLAMSFIEALNEFSGFDMPIIIDTMLGRISNESTDNISKYLPECFRGRQMILLLTDKEYSEEVRKNLSKIVFKEYQLVYQPDGEGKYGGVTEVIPYEG